MLLALASVLLLNPPVRSYVKATFVALEILPSPLRFLEFLTPDPRRRGIQLDGSEADLYQPRGISPAPRIVLVHGANPEGKDDPRVIELAESLARAGREVLVPQLSLRHKQVDPADMQRIRDAVSFTAPQASVGVLAFSYGAGLTLVALGQEPGLQKRVAFVATVGTYFDLVNLIQGVTTGTVLYRGQLVPWSTVPDARDLLAEQLASFIGGDLGRALREAWESKDPRGLHPFARALYDLVSNEDPARIPELVDRLPVQIRELLISLSPANYVDRIAVPVYALHSWDDPAAPPTESRLLVQALAGRTDSKLIEVGLLRHVTPVGPPEGRLREARKLVRFGHLILRPQEGWPRL
jgi:pimeloyl-ACP methyl ester carboxylesterase